MKTATPTEVVAAVPPLGVGGLSLAGVGLNDWVLILTAIYTVFLIVDKLPTVLQRIRDLLRKIRSRHVQSN